MSARGLTLAPIQTPHCHSELNSESVDTADMSFDSALTFLAIFNGFLCVERDTESSTA